MPDGLRPKVSVEPDDCAGHGACVETCPDVFSIGPDGYAIVATEDVPTELEALVRQAAEECPTRAIAVVDVEIH